MTFEKPLLLFDGVCNLCNSSVQFIIRHDPEQKFLFASLQSDKGQEILKELGLNSKEFDSLILIENGKAFMRSTGALRIARHFSGYWKFLYAFIIIPSFIRDFLYNFVAHNRYRFFGKKDHCMIPTPELKARFLG
jgi:predicted DCC family thiol-disulfide oxidoreductase YuxK